MKRLTFLLALFSISVCAQWTQTNGPFGSSNLTSLTRIPTGILAGSSNGIYFSNNEGDTWSDYPFFQNCYISSIIADSNEIMILYSNNFLSGNYSDSSYFCKSFDLGQSWSPPISFKQPDYNTSRLIQMQNLLFIYSDKEIFKSKDNGNNWTSTTIPNGQDIYSVSFFDKYSIVHQDSIGYLIHTFYCDSAFNFFPVESSLRMTNLLMQDSITFGSKNLGSNNWQVIKSQDLGQTSSIILSVTSTTFQIYTNKDSLYYYSNGTYYASGNLGTTFNPTYPPHFLNYFYGLPLINGDELSVWGGTGALVHYIPSIDSSYESFQGMRGLYCGLYSDGAKLYCTKAFGSYSSIDDGNSWQEFEVPCNFFSENTLINGDTIFSPGFGNTDCRSTDGGITWTPALRIGIANSSMRKTFLKNGNLYFYAGDFYKSPDLGDNWTLLPSTPFTNFCGQIFASDGPICSHHNNIFCVTSNGSIFKLASNDSSWIYLYCFPYDIWNSGSTDIISVGNKLIVSLDSLFYISDDDGQNWYIPRMDGLPRGYDYVTGNPYAKILPASLVSVGTDLIGVCGGYGIYISSNNGDDWQSFPSTTCPFYPTTIAIFNNKLFSGSVGKSVWVNSFPLGVDESAKNNSTISIFPNPSNSYFTISIPDPNEKFNVEIFDQYGKLISYFENIISRESISTTNFHNGIYFVVANDKTGNIIDRKKLVVTK